MRLHHAPTSRSGALHDADAGPVARSTDGGAICLACGATIELPGDGAALVGQRLDGRPAESGGAGPAGASRWPRACAGRPRHGPGRRTHRDARTGDGRAAGPRAPGTRASAPGDVGGARGPQVTGEPPLDAFLRTLAARDASPHTHRAYATAVGAYLDVARSRAAVDWRAPGPRRPCAPTSPIWARATHEASVAQRLAAHPVVLPVRDTGGH